jgi:hypothetical protein
MGVALSLSPPPLRSKILSFHSTFAALFFHSSAVQIFTQHTFRFSQKSPHNKKKKEEEEETEEEVKEEEEETEEK